MRIYIDSADMTVIEAALACGYVYGVTTNPTLLRRAGVRVEAVPGLAREAIARGAREIHLQVYSGDTAGMLREGGALAQLDPDRVVVKIPATAEGYAAAAHLAARGARVTLTAVYTVRQAVLAQSTGAKFIAVYLGRMRDAGLEALDLVGRMQLALDAQRAEVDILAASLRDPAELEPLAEMGVATATLPLPVLRQLVESPQTAEAAGVFEEDAQAIK
jgi:transaldolase